MKLLNSKELIASINEHVLFKSKFEKIEFNPLEFDTFFRYFKFHEGEIRLFKKGASIDNNQYVYPTISGKYCYRCIDKDSVYNHFSNGATIIFEALNEKFDYFFKLCSYINKITKRKCWANGYLTPENSQGFSYHEDEHDVLIFQVLGKKKWYFNIPDVNIKEDTLLPNDMVFIPKGLIHKAETTDDFSFHITIGLSALLNESIVKEFNKNILEIQKGQKQINKVSQLQWLSKPHIETNTDYITLIINNINLQFPMWCQSFINEIISKSKFSISDSNSIIDENIKLKIIMKLYENQLINTVPNNV